jgi:hypothetical protein
LIQRVAVVTVLLYYLLIYHSRPQSTLASHKNRIRKDIIITILLVQSRRIGIELELELELEIELELELEHSKMGLFGRNQAARKKKRTASVGIAEDNDWGSFSGLEVAIDCIDIDIDIDIDKDKDKDYQTKLGDETTKQKQSYCHGEKKEEIEIEKSTFRAAGFFFRSSSSSRGKRKGKGKETCRGCVNDESHRLLPVNQNYSNIRNNDSYDGDYNYNYNYNYNGNGNGNGNDSCNSSGSNDLSIYTSGANDNDNDNLTRIHYRANVGGSGNNGTAASNGVFVTLDHVSDLVLDLDTAVIVGAKRPIRALKMLLALSSSTSASSPSTLTSSSSSSASAPSSSNKSIHEKRIEMVHSENGKLVPVLLSFLNRCMVQSKEHTLALLLLGNLSIPQENKTVSVGLHCIPCACAGLLWKEEKKAATERRNQRNEAIFETNFTGSDPSS